MKINMKIFGKSLKEYIIAAKYFLLFLIALTVLQIAALLLKLFPLISLETNLFGLIKLAIIGYCGYFLVKKYKFTLKQLFVEGVLIFIILFLLGFALPIYQFPTWFLILNTIANLVLLTVVILIGGFLAKKFSR